MIGWANCSVKLLGVHVSKHDIVHILNCTKAKNAPKLCVIFVIHGPITLTYLNIKVTYLESKERTFSEQCHLFIQTFLNKQLFCSDPVEFENIDCRDYTINDEIMSQKWLRESTHHNT